MTTYNTSAVPMVMMAALSAAVATAIHLVFGRSDWQRDNKRSEMPLLAFEQEFLAKHVRNGQETTGFLRRRRPDGERLVRLFYRFWLPRATQIKGIVVVLHGLNNHSAGMMAFAAPLLDQGYLVAAMDTEGHGRSDGRHGFFEEFDPLVYDEIAFIELTAERFPHQKLFLLGASTGGLRALKVTISLVNDPKDFKIHGVVLQSPILDVHESSRPSLPAEMVARCIRAILPKLPLAKANRGNDTFTEASGHAQTSVIKSHDPLYYAGWLRVGTGLALSDAITKVKPLLHQMTTPFLVQHGRQDLVVPLGGSQELFERAQTKDKSIQVYDQAGHDLVNESLRTRETVTRDFVAWINAH